MSKYSFNLEFYPQGRSGGLSLPLTRPDFQPAVEWAQFEALKAVPGQFPTAGSAIVQPVYRNGGPGLNGFRVEVPVSGPGSFAADLSLDYFDDVAQRFLEALVKGGKVGEEEECRWAMSAWATEESAESADCRAPVAELNPRLAPGSLQEFLNRSHIAGEPAIQHPFKVFVPREILSETAELSRAAAPLECGGVLLGNLQRDVASGELFVVITAHVPALQAVASETELRFSPDAWCAVRAAVNLRKREETWCGWVHSHTPSAWGDKCGQCPLEKQRQCPLATRLFSQQDRSLHRTVWSRAFAVGLVANVLSGGEVVHACFGWREGKITARSYYVLENDV